MRGGEGEIHLRDKKARTGVKTEPSAIGKKR